ncbi:hypothetical protein GQX73_g3046 [Xylaria multiplex]|uniref:Uncharacterized protein n=1 Tax=Xylaria multiplex TaxID=323545 RepID=A0A7C8IW31_9PEZI|nr:hypothetical protein GQX73_g3046 [Xylaria multiplex]
MSSSKHVPPSLPAATSSGQHLSPEHNSLSTAGSSITSPLVDPTNSGAMSPFEHLSPQVIATLLQRREEYSRKLLESWQAERAHLEASRARAEEMFREERNLMDEERLIWAKQKTELENEIREWKQRNEVTETELAKLTKLLKPTRSGESKVGGVVDGTVDETVGNCGQGSSVSQGINSASTISFRTPSDGISPSSVPPGRVTIPESNPFVPLDPRMQSVSPKNIAARKDQERVPSIDIREVIPGLEGVRLRAPAIQKSTFNDEKPPPTAAPSKAPPSDPKKSTSESLPKASPAVMAQQVLLAPEHHRLTMYAGHTPSHSMSFTNLPTMESTAGNTAGSTGTSTPSSPNEPKGVDPNELRKGNDTTTVPHTDQERHVVDGLCDDVILSEEIMFEPSDDDPALKGPLCLKNRPAADEAFLRRLSDKLEEVKATEATPSVLNENMLPEPAELPTSPRVSRNNIHDANDDDQDDELEGVEEDIPLRLRQSSNFGLPLGKLRRTFDF